MIRKLRWKFSAIMMTIVAFLLAVIFITLYYTTKANYVQRSMGTLHSAMLENYPGSIREQAGQPPSAGQRPPSRPRRQELPLMVVDIRQGNYTVVKNQLPDIESQEAETLISLAESKGGESGTLKDLHLRFLRGKTKPDQTVRYVFADIYEEQNSLYWQVIHSSIIGACSFAVFFLFSILLSGWAVKPVDILGLTINNTAYIAEIVRSGIQSIPKGQWEAANCLGLKPIHTFLDVIFPQALRNIFPSLINQFIMILFGTSLLSVLDIKDLTQVASILNSQNFRTLELFTFAIGIYYIMSVICSKILRYVNNRFFPSISNGGR